MDLITGVLATLIWLYLLVLIARIVVSLIVAFARDYRPTGPVVVVFESIMMVTDPPLRVLRRVIPPLRIGQISLDLAFLVLFIALQLLLGWLS